MASFKRAPDVVPITAEQAVGSLSFEPSALDREHAATLARAKKVKDDSVPEVLGSKEIAAKFKIEVLFGAGRTLQGPNVVKLSFWESGRRLHGGGDDLMFICRDAEGQLGCGNIFTSECVRGPVAICPKCDRAMYAERLTRALTGRKTSKDLSIELAKFWRQLGGNADIYLKFDPSDVRSVAVNQDPGRRVRPHRGKAIYPLRNIIADTSAGASLEGRFFAFITA